MKAELGKLPERLAGATSIAVLALAGCTGNIGNESAPATVAGAAATTTGGADAASSTTTTGGVAATGTPNGTATSTTGATPDQPLGDGSGMPVGDLVDQLCAAQGDTLHVGRTLLRRMTRQQFNNTVRDLIGIAGDHAALISPDEKIGPFYSNARTPIVDLVVQQHAEAATALAVSAQTNMASIAPCDLNAGDATCVQQFVDVLGMKAYRRPLETLERDAYLALYNEASAVGGASEGFRYVLETLLQSPFFLYHVDVGQAGVPSATPVALSAYELASRLSYFLWNSMPDDQLFAQAQSGALLDPQVLQTEVTRLLSDPKAQDSIPQFHLQWLGIGEMEGVVKNAAVYENFGADVVAAMRAETANFSTHVILQGDGLLNTLLTANYSVIDGPLFELYGVAQPAGFVPGQTVQLDPAQRSGLLTQAAFLATHAHRDQTSPVHRGIAVRENLLCQTLEPPPADVANVAPTPSPATSTRERFAQHTSIASCASCHTLIDPIGLGFENYDPVGRFRTVDGPGPVDASGEIVAAGDDVAGPFIGAVELSQKLAQSEQAANCLANQWFRFALGRIEANDDACALKAIYDGFGTSGKNVRQLITELVLSNAFRHVRHETTQEGL